MGSRHALYFVGRPLSLFLAPSMGSRRALLLLSDFDILPFVMQLRLFVEHSQISRSVLQNSISAGPFLVFRSAVGFWRAPACRRRFPFSQHFCGSTLSCGPFVAPFSVACFWPGYFEEVAFRGFPNGFQRCKSMQIL